MDFLGVEIRNMEPTLFGMEPLPANAIRLNEKQYAIRKKDNRDNWQQHDGNRLGETITGQS